MPFEIDDGSAAVAGLKLKPVPLEIGVAPIVLGGTPRARYPSNHQSVATPGKGRRQGRFPSGHGFRIERARLGLETFAYKMAPHPADFFAADPDSGT